MPTTDTDHDRITRIEVMVAELHKRLLGNGQPGELAKLDARVEKVEERVGKVEAWHLKAIGGLLVIGILIGIIEAWAR